MTEGPVRRALARWTVRWAVCSLACLLVLLPLSLWVGSRDALAATGASTVSGAAASTPSSSATGGATGTGAATDSSPNPTDTTTSTDGSSTEPNRLQPLVVDNAGLLNSSDAARLLAQVEALSSSQQCDIVILTVNSLGSKTPSQYADDFFNQNGYGYGPNRDGLLLLVSLGTRDWYVSTSGRANSAFGDSAGQDKLMNGVVNDLSNGDYYQGLSRFAENASNGLFTYDRQQATASGDKDAANQILADQMRTNLLRAILPAVLSLLAALLIGGAVGWGSAAVRKRKHFDVHPQAGAENYLLTKDGQRITVGGQRGSVGVMPAVEHAASIAGLGSVMMMAQGVGADNLIAGNLSQILNLSVQNDAFLNKNVTRIPISSGNGGIGGGMRMGGGGMQGGFGGKF